MYRFSTIHKQTVAMIFSVFAVFLFIDSIYQFSEIKERSYKVLDKMNMTLSTLLVDYTSAYVYTNDIENLQRTVDSIDSTYVKNIYILDANGKIIIKNNSKLVDKIKYIKFDELLKDKDHSIKNKKEYLTLNTFNILDIPIGYMVFEADLKSYDKEVNSELYKLIIISLIWIIIFYILSFIIAKNIASPINDIIKKMKNEKDTNNLQFLKQPQEEFEYLCSSISDTHNSLMHLNKNLELKVFEKTKELQDLNKSLELKIKEELEKNRYKDQQILQQSRLAQMGEMISMIAHQWRQPLGAISTTAANLEMKIHLEAFDLNTKEGQEEQNKYFLEKLGNVEVFVENLTTTIDDFRNFYKPNKKSVIVRLDDIIIKSLNVIRASLIDENVEIVESFFCKNKMELYDNELMQVVLNILKNAQDNFIEKKILNPKITIKTENKTISICDNGGGIPQEILEKIFDPYFSTKSEKNGTGLGLYMSKTIVEEHHSGQLSAENIEDGVCFTINLNKKDI